MKSSLIFFTVIRFALTLASCSTLKTESNRPSTRSVSNEDYRLPNNVVPLHYELSVFPAFDDDVSTFDGKVIIAVTVVEQTSTIIFHANQLTINDNTLTVSSENSVHTIANTHYDQTLHFYTLQFSTALGIGNYSISIEFAGQLHDDFRGLYRSYYIDSSGQTRWYVSTFFAPTYARRAFPCFDEPALKATFAISIAHWPNQISISNEWNEYTSQPDSTIGNRVWTKFYTTRRMSTYLVAFMVSDFDHVATADGSFRIWSRPAAVDSARHSLGGIALLNEMSTFVGVNHNSFLSKMDQVALSSSATHAMENWGFITYREPYILWQDGVSTTRDKQNVEAIAAHEFSHQWFGNLVTPAWWKYVWLSEGFATFFEYYITDRVNPSWRMMEQFTVNVQHSALLADSLDTTHPIHEDVHDLDEINSVFNAMSYEKGASIIRMMLNFLGEPVFRRGLHIYLSENMYDIGTPDQLWDDLKYANDHWNDGLLLSHVDIKAVMDTWTNQKGYPLVTVTRNYTTATQVITQERFLLKGRGSSDDTTEYRWWIPLNFASQTNLNFDFTAASGWLRAQDESAVLAGFLPDDWILFNVRQSGYYRVNYDNENWNKLITYLESSSFTNIPAVTRAQLIDDAFNLARAGYLNYAVALSLTRYLTQETDYIPWAAAFNAFSYLNKIMAHSEGYTNFMAYAFSRVAPIHNSLGYAAQSTDEHVTNFLRAESHTLACRMGCPGCNSQSQQLIQNYYNSQGSSSVPVDLRAWAYCEGLRTANINVWEFMWTRYLEADVAGEQALILSGLGCSLNEEVLNRYLSLSITDNSGLRNQHRPAVFNSVYLSSPANVDVALKFLLNNIDEVAQHYGGYGVVATLLENIASHLVSESQLSLLREFVSQSGDQVEEVTSAAEKAVKISEENLAWLELYEDDIIQWLKELPSSSSSKLITTIGPIILTFAYSIIYAAF